MFMRTCGSRHHLHSFPTRRSSDLPGGGIITETVRQTFQYNQLIRDRYKKTWTYQLGGRKAIEEGEFDFNANLALAEDRKSTRLNSSHSQISYAVFCLKKKKTTRQC